MSVEEIRIPIDGVELAGALTMPVRAPGLVIFAHGSGSNRQSPRNRRVAQLLQARGLATLLFDLLTADEARIDAVETTLRFDVDMLAERLVAATDNLVRTGRAQNLPIAYFGGSTGAAAALIAAARRPDRIAAIVARGGRPDLAVSALQEVVAPTLLVVGGDDTGVLALNRQAASLLRCEHRLEIIPGATHLFEEPGAIDRVAELAASWFAEHFTTRQPAAELAR